MSEDVREARADVAAEKARAKAMRPWWKKKRFLLPLAFVVVAVIGAAAVGGDKGKVAENVVSTKTTVGAISNQTTSAHKPADDVTVDTCQPGTFGAQVKVKVVNHSSKTSSYLINVSVEDAAGTKVGEANGASNNVAAGQTALVDLLAGNAPGLTSCKVASVTRTAS